MKRYIWTNEKEEFLKVNYPKKGLVYCSNILEIPIDKVRTKSVRMKLKLNSDVLKNILKKSHIKKDSEYKVNHNQFVKIKSPEVAYFLGFL